MGYREKDILSEKPLGDSRLGIFESWCGVLTLEDAKKVES
jgi:hypothetical protein